MLKNTFFSPTRFMNLCRKDMVENWRTNLIRIAMLYGVLVLFLVIHGCIIYFNNQSVVDPMVVHSLNYFLFFCFLFGIIYASLAFDRLKTKTSRLSVLMNPVTPFENFFSRWTIHTVVYLLVFIIVFLLADMTRVLVCRIFYPDATIVNASLKYLFVRNTESYNFFGDYWSIWKTLLGYFLYQSFFILGAVVWTKNSFIKTLLAGMGILFSYILFIGLTVYIISGDTAIHLDRADLPNINLVLIKNIFIGSIVFITFFNWITAYFRFKETELIN